MRGFTLIELIVSLAVLSITIAGGGHTFNNMLDDYHATTSLSNLKSAFQKTRYLALNLAQDTIVCPIRNNECVSDWSEPLGAFNDQNNNLKVDTSESLHFKISNEINRGYWQKKRAKSNYIKFTAQGYAFGSATTFLYCSNSGNNNTAKQLVINFQGRIRINSYLNSKGEPFSTIAPLNCY